MRIKIINNFYTSKIFKLNIILFIITYNDINQEKTINNFYILNIRNSPILNVSFII